MDADHYALARKLTKWKRMVRAAWGQVALRVEGPRDGALAVGRAGLRCEARVHWGASARSDVRVELVAARDEDGGRASAVWWRWSGRASRRGRALYTANLLPPTNGSLVYGVRVVPTSRGWRSAGAGAGALGVRTTSSRTKASAQSRGVEGSLD